MPLTDELKDLLTANANAYVATTMRDGSPQITLTWVDTDGEHVLVNTGADTVKAKNVARDPRVAVAVMDPKQPMRYYQVRGEVVEVRPDVDGAHIEAVALRYTGKPYTWYRGRDQQRVTLVIRPDRVMGQGS